MRPDKMSCLTGTRRREKIARLVQDESCVFAYKNNLVFSTWLLIFARRQFQSAAEAQRGAYRACCAACRASLALSKKQLRLLSLAYVLDLIGGANEIRTHDLCSAIAALSQLSYGPSNII